MNRMNRAQGISCWVGLAVFALGFAGGCAREGDDGVSVDTSHLDANCGIDGARFETVAPVECAPYPGDFADDESAEAPVASHCSLIIEFADGEFVASTTTDFGLAGVFECSEGKLTLDTGLEEGVEGISQHATVSEDGTRLLWNGREYALTE